MTNREKINQKILSMSDAELAEYFSRDVDCDECPAKDFCYMVEGDEIFGCSNVFEAWFKQEAKDDKQKQA